MGIAGFKYLCDILNGKIVLLSPHWAAIDSNLQQVIQQRLQLVHRYLLDTQKTAAEITFEPGYSTPRILIPPSKRNSV